MNKNKKTEKGSKDKQFDDVLRRMLSTPPPKPEPKKQEKKTAK